MILVRKSLLVLLACVVSAGAQEKGVPESNGLRKGPAREGKVDVVANLRVGALQAGDAHRVLVGVRRRHVAALRFAARRCAAAERERHAVGGARRSRRLRAHAAL